MKSFSTKLALAAAGMTLLTMAAYAQTPNDAAYSGDQGATQQGVANSNRAAPYSPPYASNAAGNFGSGPQPLYDAAVPPAIDQSGIACVGGRGIGRFPNPVAYGESQNTIESGGEFILDRGYHGCFTYFGE
jgi:hypothetical protein